MKKYWIHIVTIIIVLVNQLNAQSDTSKGYQYRISINSHVSARDMKKQYIIEQRIENIAENNEDEDIDYTTLFDQLSFYYEHPINLNNKEIEFDLKQLHLLDQFQIKAILAHKNKHGKFITLYELQTIALFEASDIRKILPFVAVNENFDATHLSFSEMLNRGKNDMFLRYSRVLNPVEGQKELDDSSWLNSPNSKQLGSADNLYFRYRFKYQNHLSIGVTAEKDAGENFLPNAKANELFNQPIPAGFDYYSAHFYLRDVGKIRALALGDYHVQLGQGLTFWSGLAIGKSSNVMSIKRNPMGIRPYASLDENLFMRGGAISMKFKQFEFLAFGSKKMIDANIIEDTTATDGSVIISSFQASGLHSTIGELNDKDAIQENIGGGEVSFHNDFLSIGLISAFTHYSGTLNRSISMYNQFQNFNFNNNINLVNGLHYSLIKRNFNFFGESSRSSSGGVAHLHGMMASLHPRLAISVLYRNYDRDYQSVYANAIAENSTPNNEKGLFTGLQFKLNNHWEISSYFDQFEFPWMKYQVDKPNSFGMDGFLQVLYRPTKKLDIYGRVRHRIRPYNEYNSDARDITNVYNVNQWNYRINFNVLISESIRLRNRIEYMTYERSGIEPESGVLIIQDIIFKPKESKLSFSARFALFDTDSYNSRIYSYENDVLYYFRIPAYCYQGARSYLTLRYQFKRGVDLWLRCGNWMYNNRSTIGSGNNQINGSSKTDVRAQLRIQF